MESGIIELAPVFKGSAETTAEEMKEYLQCVVARFCGVTGLTVLETVDHERGAFFILGEEGKTQGIVAVGNTKNSGYYYRLIDFSSVGVNNRIMHGMENTSASSSGVGQAFSLGQYPTWMKYAKTDNGIVVGIQTSTSPGEINPFMLFNKIQKGDVEETEMLLICNSVIYASYNPVLDNGVGNGLLFATSGLNKNVIPPDKEAMAEIYLESEAALAGMRLYTNKKRANAWNKVRIGTGKYIVVLKGNIDSAYYALLMQASDADQT